MSNTTPQNIRLLEENQVFVFGSNRGGRHGKGAALIALRKFGAKPGQGDGLMGRSYGIPTKDARLKVLPLDAIGVSIARFLRFAAANPEKHFLVTPIGCGLAGYRAKQIAPFFQSPPTNVSLPAEFWAILAPLSAGK